MAAKGRRPTLDVALKQHKQLFVWIIFHVVKLYTNAPTIMMAERAADLIKAG